MDINSNVNRPTLARMMKILFILFSVAVLPIIGCGIHVSSPFGASTESPLRVIADVHATTNELIRALKALQALRTTNEPPEFWSAIANNTNYSFDHRTRAALQLFARHFKPGMTIHEIAPLLDHPNWLVPAGCNFFWMGGHPPGGDLDDSWAWACIFFNDPNVPQAAAIWFRFKPREHGVGNDLFDCLEGHPHNTNVDNIKIIGIASQEALPRFRTVFNRFGLSADSEVSKDAQALPSQPPPPAK
jgi:hypothetical protein